MKWFPKFEPRLRESLLVGHLGGLARSTVSASANLGGSIIRVMPANEYHFLTHWLVEGDVREVVEVLSDTPALVRWWPSAYLEAKELLPGDKVGVGRRLDLLMKGWLPYTMRWQLLITESHLPEGFSLDASGDLTGRGVWSFRQDGPRVAITYDWRVRADKPLLRYFSFAMKPVFAANHRWVMRMGETSLRLELARRHAATPQELARIPAPPGPTPTSSLAFLLRLPLLLVGRSLQAR